MAFEKLKQFLFKMNLKVLVNLLVFLFVVILIIICTIIQVGLDFSLIDWPSWAAAYEAIKSSEFSDIFHMLKKINKKWKLKKKINSIEFSVSFIFESKSESFLSNSFQTDQNSKIMVYNYNSHYKSYTNWNKSIKNVKNKKTKNFKKFIFSYFHNEKIFIVCKFVYLSIISE